MRYLNVICLAAIAWLSFSCTDRIVYHAYHPFVKEGWNKRDTLSLRIQMTDSVGGDANATFLVRNNSDYPYQDFAALIRHNFPDTTRWKSYKITFTLADSEGRWSGSGIGGLFQSTASLGEASINHPVNYTFKVIHLMDDEQLSGITDIGLIVTKKEIP